MHGVNPAQPNIAYINVPLDPTPSVKQGFGRVNLLGSMPINITGTTVTGPSLQVLLLPSALWCVCRDSGWLAQMHLL